MIFAHQPMQVKMSDGTTAHSVSTVFKNGNKTISISFDDSCGRMSQLRRTDLRLFIEQGKEECREVTHLVFFTTITREALNNIEANLENFQKAWEWLNESR